jgi:hypothetical protein
MKLQIAMRASEIPDGSTVTKLSGEKEYLLRKEIRFFNYAEKNKEARTFLGKQRVIAEKGTAFLVSDGYINIIPDTKRLLWHTTFDDLQLYIEGER